MATLRFIDAAKWHTIERHLNGARSERFAFALVRVVSDDDRGPVLQVLGVELIEDHEVESDGTGFVITDTALDRVHNRAITEHTGLVEFHNHGRGPARFSPTDESALEPMAQYVLDILDGRPYGAAVWASGRLHAEWFRRGGTGLERGVFRSVTVAGAELRVLNCNAQAGGDRFSRQIPLLGRTGQAAIGHLRVAVVGAGGTGSHAVMLLAYLGVRDFLLMDDDVVDATSLNRVITAEPPDVDVPKTLVARRRILALGDEARVEALPGVTPDCAHPELLEADLIVGCVDDDGPRHRLNALAVDAGIPYIDIGTGVDPHVDPPATGARIAFVLPGGHASAAPMSLIRWRSRAGTRHQNSGTSIGHTATARAIPPRLLCISMG